MVIINVLQVFYKCFVEIFGIVIFGLTGLRTNGPSDNKADPPENEGRVLFQHKVYISVACEMCCPI